MATRQITLTKEERSVVMRLVDFEWRDADQRRMDTIPGSPREVQAQDYQIMLSNILAKLRGATDEL